MDAEKLLRELTTPTPQQPKQTKQFTQDDVIAKINKQKPQTSEITASKIGAAFKLTDIDKLLKFFETDGKFDPMDNYQLLADILNSKKYTGTLSYKAITEHFNKIKKK